MKVISIQNTCLVSGGENPNQGPVHVNGGGGADNWNVNVVAPIPVNPNIAVVPNVVIGNDGMHGQGINFIYRW